MYVILKKKCASEFVQQIEKLLADLLYLFFLMGTVKFL